jgi:hypothetical protein
VEGEEDNKLNGDALEREESVERENENWENAGMLGGWPIRDGMVHPRRWPRGTDGGTLLPESPGSAEQPD